MKQFLYYSGLIPSPKFLKKYIVFLSDDWGSVRLPSVKQQQYLLQYGLLDTSNHFNRYDTLETDTDIEQLLEILTKHRDHTGRHPVITPMFLTANPDFEAIKSNNYTQYVYESVFQTYNNSSSREKLKLLIQQAIESGLFVPEFHGREHLHVPVWMHALQEESLPYIKALEQHFWYVANSPLKNVPIGAAYFPYKNLMTDDEVKTSLVEGVQLFREMFGYAPVLFTPPSLMFPVKWEKYVKQAGFKLLDTPKFQRHPLVKKYSFRINYTGKITKDKLSLLCRNAVFEPALYPGGKSVEVCLKSIERAFTMGLPAIISNHRVSFVGGVDPQNRKNGLNDLNILFKEIVKKWPEAEFISARELYEILSNKG